MISEDTPIGRRRRQGSAVNDTMEITLELGSRPEMNRSSPGVSTVKEQLNGTNTESVHNGFSKKGMYIYVCPPHIVYTNEQLYKYTMSYEFCWVSEALIFDT